MEDYQMIISLGLSIILTFWIYDNSERIYQIEEKLGLQ